ncbi:integrase [Pseudomonas songnenensis]|uniref:Integrase n=1 Tax=Pseudomonas songnenensis TaxID=1176259 RepID=A0A482UAS3_9PSED|nr:integrase [Pseudomonas songnenensis]
MWNGEPSVTIVDFHAALDAQSTGSRQYDARHTYATMYLTFSHEPSSFMAKPIGYRVQMLLSTYAKWLSSASDWNELVKLPARIKLVRTWYGERRQAINHRCYTRRTSL